jgi:hypothetical protein
MIDFNFISRLEGGRHTRGYVPNPETSRSGVTVGTGVDLGQMGDQDLVDETADVSFEDLPDGVQTVIASVAFQYGSLQKRTPNFWRQITSGDWQGAYRNLQNFGDDYGTRRKKEAVLLKQSLEESGIALL